MGGTAFIVPHLSPISGSDQGLHCYLHHTATDGAGYSLYHFPDGVLPGTTGMLLSSQQSTTLVVFNLFY